MRKKIRVVSLVERQTGQLFTMHHVRYHPHTYCEIKIFSYSKIKRKQARAFIEGFGSDTAATWAFSSVEDNVEEVCGVLVRLYMLLGRSYRARQQ